MDLERILSSPDDLEPSAGFAEAVLAAARREIAPPRLPFPWLRFGVGMAACLAMALAAAMLAPVAGSWVESWRPLRPILENLGYGVAGVAASLALTRVPRLFVSR